MTTSIFALLATYAPVFPKNMVDATVWAIAYTLLMLFWVGVTFRVGVGYTPRMKPRNPNSNWY